MKKKTADWAVKFKKFLTDRETWLFALFFLAALASTFLINFDTGDDVFFRTAAQKYNLWEFMLLRYHNWSGRLFLEIVPCVICSLPIMVWRILNAVMMLLFARGLFKLVTVKPKLSSQQRLFVAFLSCAGFGLMGLYVLEGSVFWVTGSVCYLWPVTAAIWALLPLWENVVGVSSLAKKSRLNYLLVILCTIYAAMAQEQIPLVLGSFSFLGLAYLYWQKKAISGRAILQVSLIVVIALISFLAPGNAIRLQYETARLFPDFFELSIGRHLFIALQWLVDGFFNENRVLMLALWLAGIYQLLRQKKQHRLLSVVPAFYVLLALFGFYPGFNYLFDFGIEQSVVTVWHIWAVVWWGLAVPVTGAVVYFSFPVLEKRLLMLLVYLAGFCSAFIIGFTPVLYASGARMLFVTAVLFLLIILSYAQEFKKPNLYLYVFTVFIVMLQFIEAYNRLLS